MTLIPLHRVLAKELVDAGLTTMFGLLGDGNLWLIDTFVRDFDGTYVAATHEANAVTMASGFARRSGQLGVATVTHGPGLTNTITALTDAARARLPLLVIIGDTPIGDRDHSQRLAQREVVMPTGAGFEQVRTAQTAWEDMQTAVRRALAESRPIVLNIPRPFLLTEVEPPSSALQVRTHSPAQPHADDLDEALGLLASARRPLILGGRGAVQAREQLIALADRTGALLATTLQGQSLFRGHPFDLGIFGSLSTEAALSALDGVDVVLAFGAGLNRHTTAEGSMLADRAVVQVDTSAASLGRYHQPDVALLGDASAVATTMLEMLEEAEYSATGGRSPQLEQQLAEARERALAPVTLHGELDPRQSLIDIARLVPRTRSVVTDLGRFVIDAWKSFDVDDPMAYVHTNNFGSIGLGMGYAIGTTYAAPDAPVVLVTGDGGYLMGGLTELSTAIRYRRDLIVVVVNDAAYGAEHVQFRRRDMDPSASLLSAPDFVATAQAMGAEALSVRTAADLELVADFLASRSGGPVLIDLHVHPADVLGRGFA